MIKKGAKAIETKTGRDTVSIGLKKFDSSPDVEALNAAYDGS